MAYEGEIAALTTAFCWSTTSLFFTAAGRRIGSFQVNQIRIVFAVAFLILMHVLVMGSVWPAGASWRQFGFLAASGLVGLFLGDTFYFRALVELGPKLATLLMTLHPLIAAFIAWIALGEGLGALGVLGLVVATGGVSLAIVGRRTRGENRRAKHLAFGILFGILGAVGQGAGIVIAKAGLEDFNALSGTLIRMAVACAALWSVAGVQLAAARRSGKTMALVRSIKNLPAVGFTAGGAFFGPFLGVWLSLYAIMHGEVGVVCTIMAIIPIIIIPQTWILHKERPTLLEVLGALITVAGVSLLFLRS